MPVEFLEMAEETPTEAPQEPAHEPAPAAPAEPVPSPGDGAAAHEGGGAPEAPQYMTRESFDEAMGGVTGHFQQMLDPITQQMQQMQMMFSRVMSGQQPAQPQPPQPQFPSHPTDFQQMMYQDPYSFQRVLEDRFKQLDNRLDGFDQRWTKYDEQKKQEEMSNRIYDHFDRQIHSAAEQFPVFKDNPKARDYLNGQVTAAISQAGYNFRAVDVLRIARDLDAFLKGFGPQPAAPAPAPGVPPAPGMPAPAQFPAPAPMPAPAPAPALSGSPSRPGVKPLAGPTNFREFNAMFDDVVPKIAAAAKAERGIDEE